MADKLPDLPPSPKKRINRPAPSSASDTTWGQDQGLKQDTALSKRAGRGTTIRPERDTDQGGVRSHDIRVEGMLRRGTLQPRDVHAEDDRYWASVRAAERDTKAGRDPYDTVRRSTRSPVGRRR